MSAPPVDRPRLLPHAIPLLRDRQSLQLGLCSDEALVLDGLTSREVDFVTGLDGTRDRAQVLREGRGERDEQLLHLLADAGVLAPAEARDRRQPPHPGPLVAVQGVGRLADEIALQLCDRRGARVARESGPVPRSRPTSRPTSSSSSSTGPSDPTRGRAFSRSACRCCRSSTTARTGRSALSSCPAGAPASSAST